MINMNVVSISMVFLSAIFNSVLETSAMVFSDISAMEKLLDTQYRIIEFFTPEIESIHDVRSRRTVSKFVAKCQVEHSLAMKNVTRYLMNPINAFRLVKRMFLDLEHSEVTSKIHYIGKIRPSSEAESLLETARANQKGPLRDSPEFYKQNASANDKGEIPNTSETLKLAGAAITSLITHYGLSVQDISNGSLRVKKSLFFPFENNDDMFVDNVTPMSSTDCYILAIAAATEFYTRIALEWLKEARRKYYDECSNDCAVSMIDYSLLENIIYDESSNKKTKLQSEIEINRLCTGPHYPKGLTCQYRYGPHPFLRLARLKTELMHLDPDVTMFHDVISDDEIVIVTNLSKPRWLAAKTKGEVVSARINQVALLPNDNRESSLRKLSLRVLDMSGRTGVSLAELWQVSLYGPGGYYKPHFDAKSTWTQYRSSTTMFYISDVQLGGATTFNVLDLSVSPKKYSALHWKNLLPLEKGYDVRTRHASCPLVYGTKLVAVKWLSDISASCPITKAAHINNNTTSRTEQIEPPWPLFRLGYGVEDSGSVYYN